MQSGFEKERGIKDYTPTFLKDMPRDRIQHQSLKYWKNISYPFFFFSHPFKRRKIHG